MTGEFKTQSEGAVLNVSAAKLAREAKRASIRFETKESIRFQELLPEKLAKAKQFLECLK